MNQTLLKQLRHKLIKNSDLKIQEGGKRYFKEAVRLYGVKTATVTKIANEYFKQIKDQPRKATIDLCEQLWQSGYLEESFIACHWCHKLSKTYQLADIELFESWLNRYVSNWASCDTFCNHCVGDLILMYPQHINRLKQWAKSENRWVKRGAAVSLIVPARNGLFQKEIFDIALLLLEDKDHLVQKGYGWMLKTLGQANQTAVFDFVMHHKATMPRTALRYAIEKMPPPLRHQAMAK